MFDNINNCKVIANEIIDLAIKIMNDTSKGIYLKIPKPYDMVFEDKEFVNIHNLITKKRVKVIFRNVAKRYRFKSRKLINS